MTATTTREHEMMVAQIKRADPKLLAAMVPRIEHDIEQVRRCLEQLQETREAFRECIDDHNTSLPVPA